MNYYALESLLHPTEYLEELCLIQVLYSFEFLSALSQFIMILFRVSHS